MEWPRGHTGKEVTERKLGRGGEGSEEEWRGGKGRFRKGVFGMKRWSLETSTATLVPAAESEVGRREMHFPSGQDPQSLSKKPGTAQGCR